MNTQIENTGEQFVEAETAERACELVKVEFASAKVEKTNIKARDGLTVFKIAA